MNIIWSLVCLAAWITSIIECVKTDWVTMLIVDILIFPVGVIHGALIWLGLA